MDPKNQIKERPERLEREQFEVGDVATCNNTKCLPGNGTCPELEEGKDYPVIGIITDSEGNQHLDVGLVSSLSYVSSYETGEHLFDGNKIHWCHPSRFSKKSKI